MSKEPIGWRVTWTLKDAAAFTAVAKETTETVQRIEPETELYEWCLSEDGTQVTLLEWFSGLHGAKEHLKGPAVSHFLPRLNEQAEMTGISVYGAPDQELSNMLEDLHPDKHHEICGFHRIAAA